LQKKISIERDLESRKALVKRLESILERRKLIEQEISEITSDNGEPLFCTEWVKAHIFKQK